jgi:Lytic transglycolase
MHSREREKVALSVAPIARSPAVPPTNVTVRVNDRGPYVPGRVVDVSYSAAQELGMINRGVAKVKLDVVQ